jgi:hypothetical protein
MAGVPSLSQIQAWDTQHLEAAATHWDARAQVWMESYDTVHREVPAPGGTVWEGVAADAAVARVGSDRARAVGAADLLHGVAAVARSGAGEVEFAKQQAIDEVNAAQAQGFTVSEDLSVHDPTTGLSPLLAAHRQAQAQANAAAIRTAATGLVTTDTEVAAQITAAAGMTNANTAASTAGDTIVGDPKPGDPTIKWSTTPPAPNRPCPATRGGRCHPVRNGTTTSAGDGAPKTPCKTAQARRSSGTLLRSGLGSAQRHSTLSHSSEE